MNLELEVTNGTFLIFPNPTVILIISLIFFSFSINDDMLTNALVDLLFFGFRKLAIYPNGNKVECHLSIYLEMVEESSLQPGWEVHAGFRLFLLAQKEDKYFVCQGCVLYPIPFTLSIVD